MNSLRRAWDWMALVPHERRGLRALQICMGAMLLFRASTEARFARYLWGPNGLGDGSTSAFLFGKARELADRIYTTDAAIFAILFLLATAAAGLLFGISTRLATVVALFTSLVLDSRTAQLGDGGDNITRLVLTYMIFALPAGKEVKRGSLEVWFHNVAMLAIGMQLGVLYLTSGFLKMTGDKWNNGTAMYLISQVEWFSHPALRGPFRNPYVTTLSSYATMFFQIWFPIAVLTRLRLPWLCIGIFFHIGIAVFMGLVCFSLAMIGLELFLVTDDEYARAMVWLRRAREGLWALAGRLRLRRPAAAQVPVQATSEASEH